MVDCVFNLLGGCDGSLQEKAFDYYAQPNYPMTEVTYVYKGKDGKCKYVERDAMKEVEVKDYT